MVFVQNYGKSMFTLKPFILDYGKHELYATVTESLDGTPAGETEAVVKFIRVYLLYLITRSKA